MGGGETVDLAQDIGYVCLPDSKRCLDLSGFELSTLSLFLKTPSLLFQFPFPYFYPRCLSTPERSAMSSYAALCYVVPTVAPDPFCDNKLNLTNFPTESNNIFGGSFMLETQPRILNGKEKK